MSKGSGGTRADVAISNSRIAAIGEIGGGADEVIDAGGLALMPGIIDIRRISERLVETALSTDEVLSDEPG